MPDAATDLRDRSKRQTRQRRRRRVWMITGASLALLLVGGGVATAVVLTGQGGAIGFTPTASGTAVPGVFAADQPSAEDGKKPCIALTVLASNENAELMTRLVDGYNAQPRSVDGRCVDAVAKKETSGTAVTDAAGGFPGVADADKPTVWVPDASSWLAAAQDSGGAANVPTEGTSIGSSAIVLAMPEPLADAIGWSETRPTWNDVFNAARDDATWSWLSHPEWGTFKLGKTSPLMASSGQAAMLAEFGSEAGSVAELTTSQIHKTDVVNEVRKDELATSHYMATPERFLAQARASEKEGTIADFLSAVIVDEKTVWDYNRGITSPDGVTREESTPPEEQLVPIYPSDGYYLADNPYTVLTGPWIDASEKEAARDLLRFAGSKQGQQIVRASGYHDLNGELDPVVSEVGRLPERPEGALEFPGREVIAAIDSSFPDVRKRAEVLFLVDVSGSMEEKIPTGQTKLAAAKEAIEKSLGHFTKGDNIGLAAFSAVDDGPVTPGLVSPVADARTDRTKFLDALGALKPIEFTPLYSAVDTFAKEQADAWDPERINAIVVLSDGQNETLGPSKVSKKQLLSNLEGLHDDTPVLVFTLAYGANADTATLREISTATGAQFYDATDPTKITAVLGDLVTSF
ncbi:substrate-binding and VWA domain-containing protein [Agromyces endophyticus]|uniref:vWA domain-containing protein n=1 Tax=Agromyces sp. H17E-10 TaxID=2932244 RepID=UPI001FD17D47|nr:substrate-binding domain-containing protein [Agromyces sp. H17E-10]UOQ87594.1 substrate-binding and VWA domain-containing protein [Agromyces sp. H17E-10]